jgi:hypothetical protein
MQSLYSMFQHTRRTVYWLSRMLASAMNTCRDTVLRVSAANSGRLRTTALTRHHAIWSTYAAEWRVQGLGLYLMIWERTVDSAYSTAYRDECSTVREPEVVRTERTVPEVICVISPWSRWSDSRQANIPCGSAFVAAVCIHRTPS